MHGISTTANVLKKTQFQRFIRHALQVFFSNISLLSFGCAPTLLSRKKFSTLRLHQTTKAAESSKRLGPPEIGQQLPIAPLQIRIVVDQPSRPHC